MAAASTVTEKEKDTMKNPYNMLLGHLDRWLHQLHVIGYNSGKYDLKQVLIPHLMSEERDDDDDTNVGSFFVIKRRNTFMCLSIRQLKLLDLMHYIAPGFSYDKNLKVY